MAPSQLWSAVAASGVFLALAVSAVVVVYRAWAVRAVWRWCLGIAAVAVVVVCWGWAAVPREAPSAHGPATCIEEPIVGMASSSNLSTPSCVRINREAVGIALAVAGLSTLGVALGVRTAQRRTSADREGADPARASADGSAAVR